VVSKVQRYKKKKYGNVLNINVMQRDGLVVWWFGGLMMVVPE